MAALKRAMQRGAEVNNITISEAVRLIIEYQREGSIGF